MQKWRISRWNHLIMILSSLCLRYMGKSIRIIIQFCKHPFVDRRLPIVADSFVEKEFGTGERLIFVQFSFFFYYFERDLIKEIWVRSDGWILQSPSQWNNVKFHVDCEEFFNSNEIFWWNFFFIVYWIIKEIIYRQCSPSINITLNLL